MSREDPPPVEVTHAAFSRHKHFTEGRLAHHVEMVPVETLRRAVGPLVTAEHVNSRERAYQDMLVSHMREHGPRQPVRLDYNHATKTVEVGDGHHRIYAAEELGLTHLPVVVESSAADPHQRGGLTVPGYTGAPPEAMRPSDIGLV